MKAHIICWDGIEYDRQTDREEIDRMRAKGYLNGSEESPVFDFRIGGVK